MRLKMEEYLNNEKEFWKVIHSLLGTRIYNPYKAKIVSTKKALQQLIYLGKAKVEGIINVGFIKDIHLETVWGYKFTIEYSEYNHNCHLSIVRTWYDYYLQNKL